MKRSGKFYRKNEQEVMESLGLKPTYNSGSGWIEKEDGQNDYVICQLKSTDAQSIKVNQKDIRLLERNAFITHKIPVFAIQFLNTGEIWLMVKPKDISDVNEYITSGVVENISKDFDLDVEDKQINIPVKIKSSGNARENFHKEQFDKYNKIRSAT